MPLCQCGNALVGNAKARETYNLSGLKRTASFQPLLPVTYAGIILVETMNLFPFVFIQVSGTLERMDPTLEESARILVMRAGVAQQIGTPLEVYGSPANRFVFEFIGLSCFLYSVLTETGM